MSEQLAKQSGEEYWDLAIDWLLNSRYIDDEVKEHFWHMVDECSGPCAWCREELADTTWAELLPQEATGE